MSDLLRTKDTAEDIYSEIEALVEAKVLQNKTPRNIYKETANECGYNIEEIYRIIQNQAD